LAVLRQNLSIVLALALLSATSVAGCGSSGGEGEGDHPDYAKALAGAPPALAALHEQANQLLSGGLDAYESRIAALEGYPIVVNVWGSWCGPCRFEFPAFQRLSARYGKRVAFLGVDIEDPEDAAETFLKEEPVPYPSFYDPDAEIADGIGAGRGLPNTAFYDRDGELLFLRIGQYASEEDLRADIERCALGPPKACESG
jgi:cytochrome c biogenesis protein CcmG/thiol:disulfide interchange protein DsbE